MHDRVEQPTGAEPARKGYEAPQLESLGSLESHTQIGNASNARIDRGSS